MYFLMEKEPNLKDPYKISKGSPVDQRKTNLY